MGKLVSLHQQKVSLLLIYTCHLRAHFHSLIAKALFSLKMPITSKEAAPGAAMKAEIQDYSKALEVLKTYPSQDGLDVDTLLDSDKHGALTYNDFLVLPGYVGMSFVAG